ncbi:cell division protein ZapA [Coralliovum pocilloporae]|uniref:cell division protein ZapA n=1 Tax=Coralliovum pocilloporae TaxID=3066369 RepID=UPI003307B728
MSQISVQINGKSYRMACDDGQEDHLVGLARKFDGYISQLKEVFGEIGDQRLTVMAGIMVTDELSEMQRQISGLEAELSALRDARTAVVERFEGHEQRLADRVNDAAEQLERLGKALNATKRADA